MFTKNETECTPFTTAKCIIDQNLLFSSGKINKQYVDSLFEAGEEIAQGTSFSNNLKVQYFFLLLKAHSDTQQQQAKELYKKLIQLYREACPPLVDKLITKEVSELKRHREMTSKLHALRLGS